MDAGVATLARTLASFGLEYFTFQDFPDPTTYDKFVFCRNVPSEWIKLYIDEKYNLIDTAFRQVRRATKPFIWADAPYDATREPVIAKFVQRVNDFGLARGIMIPIPHFAAPPGVVWFGGSNPEFNRHTLPSLHLVALYAFERLRKFRAPLYAEKSPLTRRERDVLTWAAAGKTAWEIGEQLDIAKRTVDSHIETAIRKLGTVNRTHAVAIAIRDRLIEI